MVFLERKDWAHIAWQGMGTVGMMNAHHQIQTCFSGAGPGCVVCLSLSCPIFSFPFRFPFFFLCPSFSHPVVPRMWVMWWWWQ